MGRYIKYCFVGYSLATGKNKLTKTSFLVLFATLGALAILSSIDPAYGGVGDIDIIDDNTGGDCTNVGDWNNDTKTCTLTTDLALRVVIANNNVTLNCDGHLINGSGSGTGIFINVKNFVTVENCQINNFGIGLHLRRSNDNTINTSNITANAFSGIFFARSNDNNLTEVKVLNNGEEGIRVRFASGNILNNNTFSGNGFEGISLTGSDFHEINDNFIFGNDVGINLFDSPNNIITGTTVVNHTNEGLNVESSNGTVIKNFNGSNNSLGVRFFETNATMENIILNSTSPSITLEQNSTIDLFGTNKLIGGTLNVTNSSIHLSSGSTATFENSSAIVDLQSTITTDGLFTIDLSSDFTNIGNHNNIGTTDLFGIYNLTGILNNIGSFRLGCGSSFSGNGTVLGNSVEDVCTDVTDPTVNIVFPINNQTLVTPFTANGTASDNVSVANVTVSTNNGPSILANGTNNWTFDVPNLAPGDHNLTVVATDEAGNTAIDMVNFTVPLPGIKIEKIVTSIENKDLSNGIENSLISKLENTMNILEDDNSNNDGAACGKLGSFINQVNAQTNKKIEPDLADELIASAESLLEILEC